VIHSGDISYADGYEPHWDDFFNKIQPIAASVPYMVSPGNHEVLNKSNKQEYLLYFNISFIYTFDLYFLL
jgi:hypothetical protein